ncbi:MAG: sodium:proton antiporter NhaD [Bacteroidales bacterium]|nr:sodium:proton antiporter NhaD [Bacteroidales bacterium]
MISIIVLTIFIVGYAAIAFEHQLMIDKAATALIVGVLCWLMFFIYGAPLDIAEGRLTHHLGEIASILFFLLGAMTIVEIVDSHNGFKFITDSIQTKSKTTLLVIVTVLTFFLSALLDNLTTAIVMTSLCGKLLTHREDKLWFVSMVVISANAGGAWSPLGDVTTTMLWIGGQVTALNIIKNTFLPSLVVAAVPLIILMKKFKGQNIDGNIGQRVKIKKESNIMLFTGIGLLLFVPAFKTVTHMPPFMGMLLALGIMWYVSSMLDQDKEEEERYKLSVTYALHKIDSSSILFFLGILLSISALQELGILPQLAAITREHIQNEYLLGTLMGLFSAIIDNVPLVAAVQGMFSMDLYPTDHFFWEFVALSSGTGGSTIIIGSAAGIAVMGIEKINFIWYLKNISWIALVGFLSGLGTYILQHSLLN